VIVDEQGRRVCMIRMWAEPDGQPEEG